MAIRIGLRQIPSQEGHCLPKKHSLCLQVGG
jgi:hypothetical protein